MVSTAIETRWWHREGDKVVCTLCPRECHIPEGQRGFCFVRANEGGRLELTTYGRSSGFCIDPIEKKPLNHFLPGTPILSFGTAGCNLGCKFCQNWDISKSREMDRLADQADPESIVAAAKQAGCRSLAFTYNDPVIWAEYAIEIAKIARAEGIKTVAVTAGYISPEPRVEFYKWMDAANVDLKGYTETFYRKLCQAHLEPVLDTLKYLKHETDVWFEITNLMIPGENDSPEEIAQMCDWIVNNIGGEVPVHFTAFHPDFKMMDKPHTPHETLIRAREQAIAAGIKYAYTGNVYDVKGQSTYCPGCGKVVIERDWYELGKWNLDGNKCRSCGTLIAGVFEDDKGEWGRKRIPVTIQRQYENVSVSARVPRARRAVGVKEGSVAVQGLPPSPSLSPQRGEGPEMFQPKTSFTPNETTELLAFARRMVKATVQGEGASSIALPEDLTAAPAYGIFVTLRRATQLRACRGRWGGADLNTLGDLLRAVAVDTATLDPRFPSVTAAELPFLILDISIMFNPQPVMAQGEDRLNAIEVGKHGLVITHPRGRGLLLPHVPVEGNWTIKAFLDGICRKAGLPPDTWRRDREAQLMTFEAHKFTSEAPTPELDPLNLGAPRFQQLVDVVNRHLRGEESNGETDEVLTRRHAEELGLFIATASGQTATAIGAGALLEFARVAAQSLKGLFERQNAPIEPISHLTLLWQPIPLRASDYPQRHRGLAQHAVLARRNGPWSLIVPGRNANPDRVGAVLSNLSMSAEDWMMNNDLRVTAFSTMNFEARIAPGAPGVAPGVAPSAPGISLRGNVRPPARAGQFYPADPKEMNKMVDKYLSAISDPSPLRGERMGEGPTTFEIENARLGTRPSPQPSPEGRGGRKSYRAVMLPHAGWIFCGETMGRTLALTALPDVAIILGPKHTPYGKAYSVAPHTAWDIPGARIPVATELAGDLLKRVPMLYAESEAHRVEHGTEVILPFLHRLNPKIRVLPIVLGGMNYEQTIPLAEALADICRNMNPAPLLIISSDMNHFASESENRRLDHLALDAMQTGDPRKLYDTCTQNDISMCGVMPACTIMQALLKLSPTIAPELVHYSNSAKISGDYNRVVGYAGVVMA